MRYDSRPSGRWRATVPPEIVDTQLEERYVELLDDVFTTYGRMYETLDAWYRERFPQEPDDSDFVYRQTILAKTCDTVRLILPAGTRANLGIYATGQSYEQLVRRLAQHPLAEMREYGDLMKVELRKVIPEFLKRVDVDDRGVAWSSYWRDVRERTQELTAKLTDDIEPEPREEVNLVDHDPEGELKVTAAVLYAASDLPDDQLLQVVRGMQPDDRDGVLAGSRGTRTNRRHSPGRAWERTQYRFDILCDYGAFRDLQRHRPLTIEWQRLSPSFGYEGPGDVEAAGLRAEWERLMERSKETHDQIAAGGLLDAAQYAVAMGYRIRFVLQMTAREAMHLAELRSQPQGHPTYRRVAQAIHQGIAAVHPAIGEAFTFMSYDDVDLERLEAGRRIGQRVIARTAGLPHGCRPSGGSSPSGVPGWGNEDLGRENRAIPDSGEEAGPRHLYTGDGYLLLAEAIAHADGASLTDVARERLFEPLAMHDTFFRDAESALPARAARRHFRATDARLHVEPARFHA